MAKLTYSATPILPQFLEIAVFQFFQLIEAAFGEALI